MLKIMLFAAQPSHSKIGSLYMSPTCIFEHPTFSHLNYYNEMVDIPMNHHELKQRQAGSTAIIGDWNPKGADKIVSAFLVHAEDILQQAVFRVKDEFRSHR